MERTSGLKECPRCGLRNRHGASQCDFCGWDFKEGSDDWMGKVGDLEKLGKEASTEEIDRNTVSKIELTMTKPADLPVREMPSQLPEAVEDIPVAPEEHEDVLAQPVEAPLVESEIAATPVVEEPLAATAFEEAVITAPEAEDAHPLSEGADITVEASAETIGLPSEDAATVGRNFNSTFAMIGVGAGLYVTDLILTTSHLIDKVLGWIVIIVASALIALSVVRLLPGSMPRKEGEEEVFLCPICHEVVGENEPRCPSCGAAFRETLAVE